MGGRMRLLDLFCGAGGAAMGYSQAGFTEIVGVDIEPQPNYPFEFRQGNALALTERDLQGFDLIHASPPCQTYSTMTRNRGNHPDLVAEVRNMLAGRPYVIENVEGAPLRAHIKLCGSMFGLNIRRHRLFELSEFPLVLTPSCNHLEWEEGRPWTVTGKLDGKDWKYDHSWKPSLENAKALMGMPWIETMSEIAEAIPPAYTKFIGEHFLSQLVGVPEKESRE